VSLWVATLSRAGVCLATDSAVGYATQDGQPHAISGEKLWRFGDIWIGGAAALRGVPLPPSPWPNPWPDGDNRPRTFEEIVVDGIAAQMADGRCSVGPLYSLFCVGAGDGFFPKLAKVSSENGVEFGGPRAIFAGGYTSNVGGPAKAPIGKRRCRTLAIAMASRAIREWGDDRNVNAGPAIAWPLNLYEWDTRGRMTSELIPEAQGLPAEWRHRGDSQMDVCAPTHRAQYLDVLDGLARKGKHPEDYVFTVSLKIQGKFAVPAHESMPAVPSRDAPATLAASPSEENS
jgi:hypothetical protein